MSTVANAQTSLHSEQLLNDKTITVLREAAVWEGHSVKEYTGVFGDDKWVFLPKTDGLRKTIIDYSSYPPEYRLTLKLIAYLFLNKKPNSRTSRVQPKCVREMLSSLVSFAKDYKQPIDSIEYFVRNVSRETLEEYFQNHNVTLSEKKNIRSLLTKLFLFSRYISFAPQINTTQEFSLSEKGNSIENKTPRIPEAISQPLLRWALNYVENYSDGILGGIPEYKAARSRVSNIDTSDRINLWIANANSQHLGPPRETGFTVSRAGNDPIPKAISYASTALLIGVPTAAIRASHKIKLETLTNNTEVLGFGSVLDSSTNQPWRPGMNALDFEVEVNMLRTACFILTGFLTGMRSSEYVTLRKGCATIEGNKVRITGKVYKTSNSTNGKTETWVTVPIVYRAIQILEKLSSSDWLFDTAAGVHNTPKFNYYSGSVAVQRFIEHANEVNKLCKTGDPIPTEIDGERFMVTPASFRRTLAWYIAAQPYGVVAGMLQYKHVQVSTFEGYAGTSASGFKLEVEQAEKAVHQLDMFDKYERVKQGEKLAGSGGAKLTEAFKTIQQELGDYPGLVVDNNRLKILLKTCADKMFSGPLSGCIFDADVALCKPQNVELLEAPLLASCKLLDCSCSVIDTSKLSAWEDRSNKLEQVVINPALLEYQKEYVCRHLEKTKKVIATISSLSSTLPKLPKDKNEH